MPESVEAARRARLFVEVDGLLQEIRDEGGGQADLPGAQNSDEREPTEESLQGFQVVRPLDARNLYLENLTPDVRFSRCGSTQGPRGRKLPLPDPLGRPRLPAG